MQPSCSKERHAKTSTFSLWSLAIWRFLGFFRSRSFPVLLLRFSSYCSIDLLMDFNPKHDPVHVPPDPPPDLGLGSFMNVTGGSESIGDSDFWFGGAKDLKPASVVKMKGAAMGSNVGSKVLEVPVVAESGIIRSVVLAESDVVCLGKVLGDNWRSRVLKEKIVFSNSDMRVSFSADTDLEGIIPGCSVNLLIEGLGMRNCPAELFSGQYGTVMEVLANLAKHRGSEDVGMGCNGGKDMVMREMNGRCKFSQLNPNVNVFDVNSFGSVDMLDKRKKRSIRNEGLQVKASKVMWDNNSYVKVPQEGNIVSKDEVLPDGACAIEMVDRLTKVGNKGMFRERVVRGSRRGGFDDNARMFSFSVAALNFSYKPGSKNGKIEGIGPVFKDSMDKSKEDVGQAASKMGLEKLGGKKNAKKVSMKKLIQEKSDEMSPYKISKDDMPFINIEEQCGIYCH
ncbi:hypothetical protein Hanom_Chr09g00830381 [Helianthus anomalus]